MATSVSMAIPEMKKTDGLEKLEFLTDKAERLIYQLETEEKSLAKMRDEIMELNKMKEDLVGESNKLKVRLSSLQAEKEKVDSKISNLLEALNALPLD